ncbi:recombinase family protein [uncultured Ruminococcus sp.]|uniref:recombinase family protein n=1 Tax=uncultured Ruminococcus sp. TaxID=165186 RepID=UPI002613B030|nr:recombinase family protein [uncultured Ruminococcus sp.]
MKIKKIEAQPAVVKKLRVAAYCRVSTENEDQKESLEAQREHYESWIRMHDDWECAGVFYDFGISGTKADVREGLQALLYACRTGSVDYVLTKSISRFSRNTSDCLSLVRELLSYNIPIYFEKENIDTGSMESELILSVLSSMAQSESESISKNVKWSVKKRMEEGTFVFGYLPYGYTKDAAGNMVIDPVESEIVRLIFDLALNGMGTYKIAQLLDKRKVPTRKGGKWSGSTVKGILVNEKYYGAAAFQKTYTDSNFRRHNNHGEVDSFIAEDHHEAIISKEVFDRVQVMIQKHIDEHGIVKDMGKYHNKYPFSGIIICGECGGKFKRQTQSGGIAWACSTHLYNKDACSMMFIKDEAIKAAFMTMMNKLIFGCKQVLVPYYDALRLADTDESLQGILDLKNELQRNSDRKNDLRKLRVKGFLDAAMYNQELRRVEMESEEIRAKMKCIDRAGENGDIKETKKLLRFAESAEMLTEFSDDLFTEYVDSIIVYTRTCIGFRLRCGLTLKEEVCTGTR